MRVSHKTQDRKDVYKRQEPLTLVGPKGLERVVNALRVIAPELPFEIKFIEITQDVYKRQV